MRAGLVKVLKEKGSPFDWSHITNQIGMFAFTGFTPEHVALIKKDFAIYMTNDGRISISGLNTKNLDYVGNAFHEVTKKLKL